MLLSHFPQWKMENLLNHLNPLSGNHLEILTIKGKPVFRAVDSEEVLKTHDLTENQKIIYHLIKAAKNKGIWVKDIKAKSGLHSQLVMADIKTLEKKLLIKSVKSIKSPTKKVYMLYDLDPSVEITGGAW